MRLDQYHSFVDLMIKIEEIRSFISVFQEVKTADVDHFCQELQEDLNQLQQSALLLFD